MRERYPEFMQQWQEDPATAQMPEGETLGQVQHRAWKALQTVYGQNSDDSVVLVGHNFTNLLHNAGAFVSQPVGEFFDYVA